MKPKFDNRPLIGIGAFLIVLFTILTATRAAIFSSGCNAISN